MLDKILTVDEDSYYFATTRNHNKRDTEKSTQVLFRYYTLQCQENTTTNMTNHKLSPSGKYYLCFQSDGESIRAAQFINSRALDKFIKTVISIESFE